MIPFEPLWGFVAARANVMRRHLALFVAVVLLAFVGGFLVSELLNSKEQGALRAQLSFAEAQRNGPQAPPTGPSFSESDRKAFVAKLQGYVKSAAHNVDITYASRKDAARVKLLESCFQNAGWSAYAGHVGQEDGPSGWSIPYIEGVLIKGYNSQLLESVASDLREAGLKSVKIELMKLEIQPDNPKWEQAQHRVSIYVGHGS